MVNHCGIELHDVCFRIGQFAMEKLSLQIPEGQYFVLTGPNGAGKSILIRLIAGLLRPTAGSIAIRGKLVTELPPWQRQVGYVPQDGVLFPHRTVADNIAFGLEVRGMRRGHRRTAVAAVAEQLGITELLGRKPVGLSGGEQQKVSIARALVYKPSALLLDEPVCSVDEQSRDALCLELKKLQRTYGVTAIHVSHNQRETELVAERVGYLQAGRIVRTTDLPEGVVRANDDSGASRAPPRDTDEREMP